MGRGSPRPDEGLGIGVGGVRKHMPTAEDDDA